MNKPVLFDEKKRCCGCGACLNVCPTGAISMAEDECGFVYPSIDGEKCVGCGRCKSACTFRDGAPLSPALETYAAALRDDSIYKSASGGMFVAAAREILRGGGAVFGAALIYENGKLCPRHICVRSENELPLLQGSKYVQSDIGTSFRDARALLDKGKTVLFSGTPCQIGGLKGYLGKTYDNLYTVDIICHGVPSKRLFNDYISYYENKFKGKIIDYKFRDKKRGQGMTQLFITENGRTYRKTGELTAYMWEFLRSNTYRESCYECKYACRDRISDATIGDYWGVYEEHMQQIGKTSMNNEKGISCFIVNTPKGKALFELMKPEIEFFPSSMEKIAKHNAQLNHPSRLTPSRAAALDSYKNGGYADLHRFYLSHIGLKRPVYGFIGLLPKKLRRYVKLLLGKLHLTGGGD